MEKTLKFYSVVVTLALISVLATCKSFDAPDLESAKADLEKLKNVYCAESMAPVRERLLADIRLQAPDYPEHGFCGFFVAPDIT